ncbi:MAG TPA: prepilin-type N-terminal cleavage/methylation domain-containing protein [Candidatus Paceibacterota bacterium]|nr:prepilin-type N-terminal cleavage/methylation domain-containing protein [Candidatus Paceibacterota bacterium]
MKPASANGYTLIELIIAVGLFALVMTLASGAYLLVIGIERQTQGITTGIDNLSFALETMTRIIRTGTNYSCNDVGDCTAGGSTFSVKDQNGVTQSFTLSGGVIMQNTNIPLTDPSSVTISSLMFYVSGTGTYTATGDINQPHVTIIVSGTVSAGPGKSQAFSVETGATMRGTDL